MPLPSDPSSRSVLPEVPPLLRRVYALHAARLASGVRLTAFAGRWLALDAEQALQPRALALCDEEPSGHPLTGFKAFQRQALAVREPGARLVFVALEPGRWTPRGSAAVEQRMVALRLELSGHAVGLAGQVDIDEDGQALRIAPAFALLVDLRLL